MYFSKLEVKPVKSFIFHIQLPSEWIDAGCQRHLHFMKDKFIIQTEHYYA